MRRANLTRALAVAAETVSMCQDGPSKAIVRERLWAAGFDIDMIDLVMAMYDLMISLRRDD
jgi:hypothetical protein